MQDRDLVAKIVAGDPAGLAAAYDTYASALYAYCRTMLRNPEDAADALQDTFVVAAQKLDGLRDPDSLRPWLYAVARNECLRRVRARASVVELDQAGEVSDDAVDLDASLHEADVRSLIWAAIQGLNESEREVFELNVRHELEGAQLAAALGVSTNHAHALLSRARGTLEKSLGALLVARTGREDCPELAEILTGWDGELTALLRKRINRHIEDCDICGERKRRELRPEALLGALPILLLPPGLRAQVMHLVGFSVQPPPAQAQAQSPSQGQSQGQGQGQGQGQSQGQGQGQGQGPSASRGQSSSSSSSTSASGAASGAGFGGTGESASEYCKRIAKRAEPFNQAGFPVPLRRRRRPFADARRKTLATAAVVLLVLLGLGGYTAVNLISPTSTADIATPSQSPTLVVTLDSSSSAPVQIVISSTLLSTSASASPSASPSPSRVQVVIVTSKAASPSRSPSPVRSPSASPSPPPPPGTLVVSDPTSTPYVVWATASGNQGYQGTFTLTAQGGSVATFNVVVPTPSQSWGYPIVNPTSYGVLKSGSSVTVSVTLQTYPRNQPVVLTIEPANNQKPILVTVSPYNPIT